MKNIVIIGAGYAGVLTAKKLEKKLRKNDSVGISIIDKAPFHTMLTELHEAAAGRVSEQSIRISLKKIFARRNVEVVLDTVSYIDFERRLAVSREHEYQYDYLVIAAGSKPTFFGVPGAGQFTWQLWSYEDAVLLKEHIHECFRKAAKEADLEKKKNLLSFYVVGAGFTGVEMIGELAEYVPVLCRKYEVEPDLVSLNDVDILPRVVPVLPEKLSAKAQRRLEKMGVSVMMETGVTAIGEDYIELKKGEAVQRHPAGTVIWTAGIESADLTEKAAQKLTSAGRGRIKVDEYLRAQEHEEVYVVGDNMMYIPPGEEAPVPQMVENCEQSADTAAHNIRCAVLGKGEMEAYKPSFHGIMVCIGGRYGVARVGTPKHMFNLPSFFAMFAKHFINIVYFAQVLGWNKIAGYLTHEFFTIRHGRSFVGGHFSNRTPSFLLVPLRVFLGGVWLYEGVHKIVENWLTKPMLRDFFGGASKWYEMVLNGGMGGPGTADGVASATGAADTISAVAANPTIIIDQNIFGLLRIIFVSGREIAASSISDFAFKLNIPLMNWFVDHVILAGDGIQIFMQFIVVLMEIFIGLALIFGLFTFPASALSLALQAMFVCTTGLYLDTVWMVFAGIAVLIGAGRTFGLDYYVMPWLKRKWSGVSFAKRWYLYHD